MHASFDGRVYDYETSGWRERRLVRPSSSKRENPDHVPCFAGLVTLILFGKLPTHFVKFLKKYPPILASFMELVLCCPSCPQTQESESAITTKGFVKKSDEIARAF